MKTALLVLAIIISVIFVITIIRVRVRIEYSEHGFRLWVRVLFIKLKFPAATPSGCEERQQAKKPSEKPKGGKLPPFQKLLRLAFEIAGKTIHSLRIDLLRAHVRVASQDPFTTAMMFGGAGVGVGLLLPVLENNMKVRKKDISVDADFEAQEPTVFFETRFSIAVWQIVSIAISFVYHFLKLQKLNHASA